jgi:hypothetical protein
MERSWTGLSGLSTKGLSSNLGVGLSSRASDAGVADCEDLPLGPPPRRPVLWAPPRERPGFLPVATFFCFPIELIWNVVKVMQVRDEVGELLQMWSNCDWQRGGSCVLRQQNPSYRRDLETGYHRIWCRMSVKVSDYCSLRPARPGCHNGRTIERAYI